MLRSTLARTSSTDVRLSPKQIELLGEPTTLHPNVGIFVTMNPGYAGRSNLPDNLKQLFRAVAMTVPDRGMIARVGGRQQKRCGAMMLVVTVIVPHQNADGLWPHRPSMPERWCACKLLTLIPRLPGHGPQVMLFSQGIETAEELAGKIVLLFHLCEEQLSPQPHYDFGLRALKTVLVSHHGIPPTVAHTRFGIQPTVHQHGSAYNPPSLPPCRISSFPGPQQPFQWYT